MRIQELAAQSGLSAHAIRFYEKEGLLDSRHVRRERNNYRSYSDEAPARLRLIRKFQSIGCSLGELKELLRDQDQHIRTDQEIVAWLRQKMAEIERKKAEYDEMLQTLNWMLEYRMALMTDPERAKAMWAGRHSD